MKYSRDAILIVSMASQWFCCHRFHHILDHTCSVHVIHLDLLVNRHRYRTYLILLVIVIGSLKLLLLFDHAASLYHQRNNKQSVAGESELFNSVVHVRLNPWTKARQYCWIYFKFTSELMEKPGGQEGGSEVQSYKISMKTTYKQQSYKLLIRHRYHNLL